VSRCHRLSLKGGTGPSAPAALSRESCGGGGGGAGGSLSDFVSPWADNAGDGDDCGFTADPDARPDGARPTRVATDSATPKADLAGDGVDSDFAARSDGARPARPTRVATDSVSPLADLAGDGFGFGSRHGGRGSTEPPASSLAVFGQAGADSTAGVGLGGVCNSRRGGGGGSGGASQE
jgi:hypothetical protein